MSVFRFFEPFRDPARELDRLMSIAASGGARGHCSWLWSEQVESPLTGEEERDGVRRGRHPDRTSSWISRHRCWTAVFVRGAAAHTDDDGAVFDGWWPAFSSPRRSSCSARAGAEMRRLGGLPCF